MQSQALTFFHFMLSSNVSDPITITQNALGRVESILQDYFDETGLQGYLQISIVQKGCSGLSYNMEIVVAPDKKDLIIRDNIAIKANSLMFLLGSEMDYEIKDTSAGFVFKNPNEKRNCHCGAAFYV